MNISERPHYEIMSTDLADWLDRQGDHWWTFQGDPLLPGRVFMPSPSDELAAVFRFIDLPILVEDCRPVPKGKGEKIGADELDTLVRTLGDEVRYIIEEEEKPLWFQNRVFYYGWKDRPTACILEEDLETTLVERADQERMAGKDSSNGASANRPG